MSETKPSLGEFGKKRIFIVSHDRDEIYKLCDRTMVMGPRAKSGFKRIRKELFETAGACYCSEADRMFKNYFGEQKKCWECT